MQPAQGTEPAQVAVARYFPTGPAPTLVIDGRRLPMGDGLAPQTASANVDLALMRDLLNAHALEVQFGRDAGGEASYTYDVSKLASALRIGREVCGAPPLRRRRLRRGAD